MAHVADSHFTYFQAFESGICHLNSIFTLLTKSQTEISPISSVLTRNLPFKRAFYVIDPSPGPAFHILFSSILMRNLPFKLDLSESQTGILHVFKYCNAVFAIETRMLRFWPSPRPVFHMFSSIFFKRNLPFQPANQADKIRAILLSSDLFSDRKSDHFQ